MNDTRNTAGTGDVTLVYEFEPNCSEIITLSRRRELMSAVDTAMGTQDFDTAIRITQELVDANAGDAGALAIQAWASVRGGDASDDELRAALANMDRAVDANRRDDQAVYHRGLMHKRLGDVLSAFRDFARAVVLNPAHAGAEREVRSFAMRARKG